MVDTNGQEHMIMTFYVQGAEVAPSELSYLDLVKEWVEERSSAFGELTLNGAADWVQERTTIAWRNTINLFKYLSGTPIPPPVLPPYPANSVEPQKPQEKNTWSFAGMFSSLKGAKGGFVETAPQPSGRVFTEGQVHANLIRV